MSASWQSRNVLLSVRLWKSHVKLIVPVKRRQALLASNLPRNSRPELIRTMGMARSSRCVVESGLGRFREEALQVRATFLSADRFRDALENAR